MGVGEIAQETATSYSIGRLGDKLAAILDPHTLPPVWLHDKNIDHMPAVPEGVSLTELFRAYKALRFEEQLGYAMYMLRSSNEPRPPEVPRPEWRRLFAFVVLLCLHVVIVFAHFAHLSEALEAWLHIAAIWCALLAIAAKTLVEGLGASKVIERHQEYRTVDGDLLRRLDPDASPQECIKHMMELD